MRIASYNVQNLFARARALSMGTWAAGRPVLEAHAQINELFQLLFKVAFDGKNASALGEVQRLIVRTDKEEDLSLLMKNKQALAIVSERSRPQNELFAEVGELLKRV